MQQVDKFRFEILKYLAATKSFKNAWVVWEPLIRKRIDEKNLGTSIFDLGEHLSSIFQGNVVEGRGQDAVSGGGNAWECLIAWYLNLIFYGTNVIATRQKQSFVPKVINNSLTVTIANHQTNTESDIVVYQIPNSNSLSNISLDKIEALIRNNLEDAILSVVQCKTNWNDNAQIPMLWDLIYNSKSFKIPNVSVGVKGVNPYSFKRFSYSFVTVPTVKSEFKPGKLAVLRVNNLTGGNYWGHKTKSGVCSCINEYFLSNFPDTFSGGVITHIENNYSNNHSLLESFLSLKFS